MGESPGESSHCVLTLVERKSGYLLIGKLPARTAAATNRALLGLLARHPGLIASVLFTALAFGAPLLLSDIGGFAEVAGQGAAALVAPGDAGALAAQLGRLLADPDAEAEEGVFRCLRDRRV